MKPPPLTPEQRAAAAAGALQARRRRSEVRTALGNGTLTVSEVLAAAATDDALARLPVVTLLEALPGIGPARAAVLMERAGIATSRRVRGLGVRQRAVLLDLLGDRAVPAMTRVAPLVVLAGPSGVGKSTVVDRVVELDPQVWVSVSVTTRAPRAGEVDGVDYSFVSAERFDQLVASGQLLEWAEFAGNRYGTPREAVDVRRAAGVPVLLEIELQGARQVRATVPDATLVFLAPPSWEELVRRLTGRGTESADVVERRLQTARVELAAEGEFDCTVVNTEIDQAARAVLAILRP